MAFSQPDVPSQVVGSPRKSSSRNSRHAWRELTVVGVIPGTKRRARDVGFRFDQPLCPELAASRDYQAMDGYSSAPRGPLRACGRRTHLSERLSSAAIETSD